MELFVIIVAGGTGTRMKSKVPKQFMLLNGKPILMHSIQKFATAIPNTRIIVVIAKPLFKQWKELCVEYKFNIPHQLTIGGKTRYDSVKQGLKLVPDGCVVGVHDAARPLVSVKTIRDCVKTAEKKGNAVPFTNINDSLRLYNSATSIAIKRETLAIIQTPQCFRSDELKKAFKQKYHRSFTDEACVLETMGKNIHLIAGNRENIKITTHEDLILAETFLKKS